MVYSNGRILATNILGENKVQSVLWVSLEQVSQRCSGASFLSDIKKPSQHSLLELDKMTCTGDLHILAFHKEGINWMW